MIGKDLSDNNHREWFETIAADTVSGAARRIGVPQRTLASQLERSSINPVLVIALAKEFGIHPVRALVDTGYLEAKWAVEVDPASALRRVSARELVEETFRRMTAADEKFNQIAASIDQLRNLPKMNGEV